MSRWFRVYAELIDDPKFIRLGPDLRSALFMMWCIAAGNDGLLPPLADIAIKFRLSETRTQKMLDELRRCGFVDDDETGTSPHNWNGRQYKSDVSNERVKRYRQRKRNVTVTPPDTEQKQIAETERISADAFASRAERPNLEAEYFRRAKEVCGPAAGGLAKKLLTARDGNIALARAAVEQASTKQDPREYLGAIIRNRDSPSNTGRSF